MLDAQNHDMAPFVTTPEECPLQASQFATLFLDQDF